MPGCNLLPKVRTADLLKLLELGNSVAEHDAALERYFVETATFDAIVEDKADIVAGDKGTGKTALFRILQRRYTTIEQLHDVEVLAAFNPVGSPVFHRLTEGEPLEEGQYISLWKGYFLALAGNWLLELYVDAPTECMRELDDLLQSIGLRSNDDSPNTIFSQLFNLFRRLLNPSASEVSLSPTPNGLPVIAARMEYADPTDAEGREPEFVSHDDALALLNRCLGEIDVTLWLALDRLDEAFAGFPKAEIPALRALLRTYLDLNAFDRIRLKLFLRNDLFRRVAVDQQFVNLSHVNARKVEIVWDEADLYDLLYRRIKENDAFMESLLPEGAGAEQTFAVVFPEQVDAGSRKPTTWRWIMGRIADGNGLKPPRNLIDLVQKAQEEESRAQNRRPADYTTDQPVIGSESLKKGLTRLSQERVQDTLLAEAGDYASLIDRFRNQKAEHNLATLGEVLGVTAAEVPTRAAILVELGFLEPIGANWKVPMLYRQGLGITQGKAFAPEEQGDEDEE